MFNEGIVSGEEERMKLTFGERLALEKAEQLANEGYLEGMAVSHASEPIVRRLAQMGLLETRYFITPRGDAVLRGGKAAPKIGRCSTKS